MCFMQTNRTPLPPPGVLPVSTFVFASFVRTLEQSWPIMQLRGQLYPPHREGGQANSSLISLWGRSPSLAFDALTGVDAHEAAHASDGSSSLAGEAHTSKRVLISPLRGDR